MAKAVEFYSKKCIGRRHSIYQKGNLKTQVPRHSEVIDELARKICKDLEIPFVR